MGRQLKDDLKGRGITSGVIALLVRAGTAAQVFTAITVVVPLTLWVAWPGHSTITEPIVLTLFCLSFAWASLSILRWQRCLRRMGWQSPSKLSFGRGGLPEDSDEAELWRRGVHVRYSFLAVIVCMAAFALVKYFTGDY